MPLLTGGWSLAANGHKGDLVINSVSPNGLIGFDIFCTGAGLGLGPPHAEYKAGFWDEASQFVTLHITSFLEPGSPIEHTFAFEGYQYSTPAQLAPGQDVLWTLVGHFSMTGATPIALTATSRRHRFGWSATIIQTL